MKLRRLITLTASASVAAVLSACGGGGETGPQWAKANKQALAEQVAVNIQTYATPCEDLLGGAYSSNSVLATYQTSDGNFEQLQTNWYVGAACTTLDLVVKYPPSKVTSAGTFVDPDLGLVTTRQIKDNPGGEMVLVKVGAGVTFERTSDNLSAFYDVTLSAPPGATGAGNFIVRTPVSADTQKDVAAYQDDKLYWGDSTLDSDGFPTTLQQEATQVFTRVANTPENAPALP
jgi:hypothetical protein